jgi:hypothetical protein
MYYYIYIWDCYFRLTRTKMCCIYCFCVISVKISGLGLYVKEAPVAHPNEAILSLYLRKHERGADDEHAGPKSAS